jgi:hypothetical protein
MTTKTGSTFRERQRCAPLGPSIE